MPQSVTYVTTDPAATQEVWKVLNNGSTDLTVETGGVVVLASASVGAVTISLPPANENEDRMITVKKTDSTSNFVTIDPDGSETIDGDTFKRLTVEGASLTIISDGTEWHIL